ncbi:hypothetical protein LSH36_18g04024 [Paralvinella palmiformis]|uniref:Uncharacterized protein n=1 Tax=Paralvinella palmiformis TaxID=53620 RepID=A0AAD9NIE4_9ANNE|nr:hypothetical protein LSH36_18g04024 [Paralvinella palmiformis]
MCIRFTEPTPARTHARTGVACVSAYAHCDKEQHDHYLLVAASSGPRYATTFSYDLSSFCFQIRVVNAFQEPTPTPSQLPYPGGRPSFASLISAAAKAAAAQEARAAQENEKETNAEVRLEPKSKSKEGETSV